MRRTEFRSSADMRMRKTGVEQVEFRVRHNLKTISFVIFFGQILAKLAVIIVSRQQNCY